MKPKRLRKKIQQLEKRVEKDQAKLAGLKRKLQEVETAKALKAARKSAARATAVPSPAEASSFQKKSAAKKPKKKLNLSPERRAQLSAAMKARWEAKRAAAGNSSTPTNQNSPSPPTQAPENKADGR